MVSYHSQLITSHNGISDVLKPPESCRSGWGQTDSQFPISILSLPLHFITSLSRCQLKRLYIFLIPRALWKNEKVKQHTLQNKHREIDVGVGMWALCEAMASVVWLTDWLAECLSAWLKPLPGHSTGAVLAYEWYCIVRALPIPALLNGFNHWFRFSYTVLVESVPLPPLWTPWFPWLTCLEAAVEMSCRPSHGPDLTFILIGNKKMTWDGIKPVALF